jgi:hypothetical protein
MDLMTIMMAKIKRTEARCAIFERDCKEKDLKILSLQRQLDATKVSGKCFLQIGKIYFWQLLFELDVLCLGVVRRRADRLVTEWKLSHGPQAGEGKY